MLLAISSRGRQTGTGKILRPREPERAEHSNNAETQSSFLYTLINFDSCLL